MVAYTDKIARVYLSGDSEEILNLYKYTDPFSLSSTLESMEYDFNSGGTGTYSINISVINPSFHFENTFLQLYRMYFIDGKESSNLEVIDDPTLTFYLRWGYGDVEEDGLSRVISCKLTDIQYSMNSDNEKVTTITLVDNLSYALTRDPSHQSDANTLITSKVDCLEDGKLIPPGGAIGELISQFLASINGVKPVSLLYYSRGIGHDIDELYSMLANRISSGDLTSNIAVEGLGEEVNPFSNSELNVDGADLVGFEGIDIDLIQGVSWDDVRLGNSPSDLQKIAAYQLLMSYLGINFSFGYEELNNVTDGTESRLEEGQDLTSQITAAEQLIWDTEFDSLEIEVPLDADVFSGGFYGENESVGTVEDILNGPLSSEVFPSSSYKNNKLLIRPGGFPLTYGNAELTITRDTSFKYNLASDGYYSNPSRTYFVLFDYDTQAKIRDAVTEIKKEKGLDDNGVIPENSKIDEEYTPGTINVGDSVPFAYISISKSVYSNTATILSNLVDRINSSLLPYNGDEGNKLTVVQSPWSTLNNFERDKLSSLLGGTTVTKEDSVVLITSSQSIRDIFEFDIASTESDELKLFSFPQIQDSNTLKLSMGYNDSIVTKFDFNESIMAAYPTSMVSYSLFNDVANLFVEDGNIKSWQDIKSSLLTDLALYTPSVDLRAYFGAGVETGGEVTQLRYTTSNEEFINRYVDYVTRLGRSEGGEYRGILDNSKYASLFAELAESGNLNKIFGDDISREYTYETKDGRLEISKTEKFKSVSIGSHIVEFASDYGVEDVSDYTRARFHQYLYSDAAFSVNVATLGIPEISNPILDLGGRGSRRVYLRVSETRLPGSSEHWISGYYEIIGYSHRYNRSTGYTTHFNILRNPNTSRVGAFSGRN